MQRLTALSSRDTLAHDCALCTAGKQHATTRTSRLLRYRRPPATDAAGRIATHPLAAAVARAIGDRAADGADGNHAAAGPADAARSSELELARIRHACRALPAQGSTAPAQG